MKKLIAIISLLFVTSVNAAELPSFEFQTNFKAAVHKKILDSNPSKSRLKTQCSITYMWAPGGDMIGTSDIDEDCEFFREITMKEYWTLPRPGESLDGYDLTVMFNFL